MPATQQHQQQQHQLEHQLEHSHRQQQQQQQQHEHQEQEQPIITTNIATNININIGDDNVDLRRAISELRNVLKQANSTYDYIRNRLSDYTEGQFLKTPEQVHVLWLKHMLQLKHPLTENIVRDFDQLPDVTHFMHIVNEPINGKMLVREFQKVYTTLRILDYAFDGVTRERNATGNRLLHDLNQDRGRFDAINDFFTEAYKYVRIDLQETKEAMKKLKIATPRVDNHVDYNAKPPIRDWLLASEHLSVMQYLRVLYMILLQKCQEIVHDDA